MKILLTGTTGLSMAVKFKLEHQHTVIAVSKSTGHDILNIDQWGKAYTEYDTVVNCACDHTGQLQVLEFFYKQWQHNCEKTIINIGSIVSDYVRTEKEIDFEYSTYRLQKQSLQLAFQKMSRAARCDIKLINPGPIDTAMASHLKCKKLSIDQTADHICWMLTQPAIKRIDLWL